MSEPARRLRRREGSRRRPAGWCSPNEILRQPDGKLIVVGDGVASGSHSPLMVIARLDPDGGLDPSFGSGGVEELGIQNTGPGDPVALLASGELVATGGVGTAGLVSATNPTVLSVGRWVVVELTSTGGVDPAFGTSGVATLPPAAAEGTDVAIASNGEIVTTGLVERSPSTVVEEVSRVSPAGGVDPTFNGGVPAVVPGVEGNGLLVAEPDGSVVLGVFDLGGQGGLARFTAAGALDATFGSAGVARLPTATGRLQLLGAQNLELLPAPDEGVLAIVERDSVAGLGVYGITSAGAVDRSIGGPSGLRVRLAFGGADQLPLFGTIKPQPVEPLVEDSFADGIVVVRPAGGYLVAGTVSVLEQTGSGDGPSISDFAIAGLTPQFAPDTSFGGRATRLRIGLRVPAQTASADHRAHGMRVTLDMSAPGDVRIVIRAGSRVVAQVLVPVLSAGPHGVRVVPTAFGARWLAAGPVGRLTARAVGRDLLASSASATASGALR